MTHNSLKRLGVQANFLSQFGTRITCPYPNIISTVKSAFPPCTCQSQAHGWDSAPRPALGMHPASSPLVTPLGAPSWLRQGTSTAASVTPGFCRDGKSSFPCSEHVLLFNEPSQAAERAAAQSLGAAWAGSGDRHVKNYLFPLLNRRTKAAIKLTATFYEV